MKLCPHCNQHKDESAFARNRSRADGLQAQCRQCVKGIQHNWYVKHRAVHYENIHRRRRELADGLAKRLLDYLAEHPCVDCGESNPIVLEFDPMRDTKKFSLRNHFAHGSSWQVILKEIETCEVRCANCHRLKTAQQFGYRRALMAGLQASEAQAPVTAEVD